MSEAGRHAEPEIKPKTYCTKISDFLGTIQSLAQIHLLKFTKRKFIYFIIDESDIQRIYAKKLRGIKKVRDGSTGNNHGRGYPLMAVIGITKDGEGIPLILRRYNEIQKARKQCMEDIINTFGPDHGAVWLLDRGFDDKKFINKLLDENQEFIIRLDRQGGQRNLELKDIDGNKENYLVSKLTEHMKKVGYRRVYMPKRNEKLSLVHYCHGKKEPLALLTTLSPQTSRKAINTAMRYLERWKIETYLLFIKQSFELEKIMIQLPQNVDGLLTTVLIASHFIMKEKHEMAKNNLKCLFDVWAKKEGASLCWSSVARFYRYLFKKWSLIYHRLRSS
jgi:hypothetical protein